MSDRNLGFLRLSDIARPKRPSASPHHKPRIPASQATIWRWVKEGKFPAPVKLSAGVTAWRASDVDAWLESRGEA